MGFWTEVKHALNSTLGTENFMPLDKIYTNGKSLVASDNIYLHLTETKAVSPPAIGEIYEYAPSLKMNSGLGSFKIALPSIFISMTGNKYDEFNLHYIIYKNGQEYKRVNDISSTDTGSETTIEFSGPMVSVLYEESDVFSFALYLEGSFDFNDYPSAYMRIGEIVLYADVKDTSLIKIGG